MNLFNNELIKLPPAIAKLEQLEEFNAADNKLKTTPNLDGLTSLTRLALFNNNIVIMPPLRGIAKIQKIELYRNQLDVLPTIDTFDQMDEFQVANNRLMALPDNIGQQSGLEALEASRNMLTQVPESVCKLDKLWKLMLSNNKVNISWLCVYAMEFMLPNIKHGFDLFSHRLPPSPSRKHSPLFSRARTHKLTSLPPALFKLSLRTLDISANLFEELPAGLDDCNTLVNLMAGFNQIRHFPAYLSSAFPRIKRLTIESNPIEFEGEAGTANIMVQQELTAKFSAMSEGKFIGVTQGASESTNNSTLR